MHGGRGGYLQWGCHGGQLNSGSVQVAWVSLASLSSAPCSKVPPKEGAGGWAGLMAASQPVPMHLIIERA